MEALLIILVPGVLGGLLFALLFFRYGGRPDDLAGGARLSPPSIGMINMSHIRVSGVGGLGMVAMATVVAIFVPRIRLHMAIALLLGAALAGGLIVLRRRRGPLGSNNHPGAHSPLLMHTPAAAASAEPAPAPRGPRHDLAAIPAR